jgi:choline dehydrogenase-like flavoprotein
MINTNSYQAKQFNLSGLIGISDQTLEMHFKLYEGYVKETNKLTEKISEFLADGNVDQEEMPTYSELTRRLGFEYNGMVLQAHLRGNCRMGSDPANSVVNGDCRTRISDFNRSQSLIDHRSYRGTHRRSYLRDQASRVRS